MEGAEPIMKEGICLAQQDGTASTRELVMNNEIVTLVWCWSQPLQTQKEEKVGMVHTGV